MFLILSSLEDNEYTTSKKTVGTEGSEVMDTEITPKPRGTKKVAIRNQVGEEASGKKVFEQDSMSTIHSRSMASAISKILRELDTEISYLKGRIFPVSGENTMSILY